MRIVVLLFILLAFQACTKSTKKEDLSHEESVKLEQYMVEGQQLYLQYCSSCHQADGTGLAELFPPLKDSDFLTENFYKTLCSMKYGLSGEVVVNGITYNQAMPGVPTLTELEIAEISTYIYNTWGDKKGIVSIDTVKQALKECNP